MKDNYIYKKDFKSNIENFKLEFDSVYVVPTELSGKIFSHRGRPLYCIKNKKKPKKSIVRKVRSTVGTDFTGENILMDYLNARELGLETGDEVLFEKASKRDYIKYLNRHPNEDIRIAFKLFLIGVLIGVISIVVGIIGIIPG